jgi:hypothetical protein
VEAPRVLRIRVVVVGISIRLVGGGGGQEEPADSARAWRRRRRHIV